MPKTFHHDESKQQDTACSKLDGLLVYFAATAASMYVVAMGISSTLTSSTTASMKDPRNGFVIEDHEITLIASLLQITGLIGAILAGYISERYGRKGVLMFTSAPFLTSWLMISLAPSVPWIYTGRVIAGICTGVITVTGPTYLTEISSPENRGRLGTFFALAFCTGLFAGMSLGTIITWRSLAMVGALVVTITAGLLFFAPESPYWLIANGNTVAAIRALKFLRGKSANAEVTCEIISNSLKEQQSTLRISEFRKPVIYKPLLLGLALIFFQQNTGANALISFTEDIFSEAGGSLDPSTATLVVAGIQVPFNILGLIVMDKAGRRIFYIGTGIVTTIGLTLLGIFMYFSSDTDFTSKFGWLPLTGYILFFLALALGYGSLPFIYITEMTPLHARSVITSIATCLLYLSAFTVAQIYSDLQRLLTPPGVFFLYAGLAFVGIIFGVLCLPETKGKSLEDIQAHFAKASGTELECLSEPDDALHKREADNF